MEGGGLRPAMDTKAVASGCGFNPWRSSEFDTQFHPRSSRHPWSEKRDALQWVIPGLISRRVRREGPGDKDTLGGESRIRQLRRRIVVAIEQIVDLNGELKPSGQIIVSPEVGHRVARRDSRSKIVGWGRLIRIVFVASRIRTRYSHFIEIDDKFRSEIKVRPGLPGLLRNQRDPVARMNVDIAIKSGKSG